jgi:SpoVK/Ycf46/Vps4 family AAA+-type ATPase
MREDFIKLKMEGLSFSEPWIIRTATNENISLSMLENITNFTKLVCKNNSNKFVEEVFDKALCRTSEFFKYTQNVVNVSNTENYNKDFINADIDLGTVSESLRHHSQARICLSGPPGCGKTGYAFYLARLLDKPIISKKGSDILGRYLGETEKNLAKAFNEAHSLDSILLIDEVDGLLSNRQNAQRHWEISMVNELLTQIDSFKGLLVVTTNLFNQIDPAAMRRFDLKVNFNYLNADQIGKLWDYQVNQLCLDNNFESKQEAMVLKELTPGDFATINRQSKFMPIKDAIDLMSRLKKEVSYKHNYGVGKAIGFLI